MSRNFNEFNDVLDFKEFKQLLGFGKNKCYDLLKTKTIASKKIGRDYRILKKDVINFLES